MKNSVQTSCPPGERLSLVFCCRSSGEMCTKKTLPVPQKSGGRRESSGSRTLTRSALLSFLRYEGVRLSLGEGRGGGGEENE